MMEIIINGEITSETASKFDALEGDVMVRLNSYGGDVGSALAIYNRLKEYSGAVNVVIDGICCSASTIIACAGHSAIVGNGLYMIHSPLMELWGDYNAEELNKKTKALLSIEKIIVETYAEKTGMAPEELTRLMYAETWYTAEEAVAAGFVDELLPLTATVTADNDDVTINDMTVSVKRFANKQALLKMKAGGKGMDNQTLLSKLKAFFGREKSQAELELESEVLRLRGEIERLRSEVKTADQIYALIEDNIKSGGGSVRGSTLELSNAADDAITKVVRFANGRM